jgi:hypothetical protein
MTAETFQNWIYQQQVSEGSAMAFLPRLPRRSGR